MLIFDQLKRSDQPLRVLAFGILGGMTVLLVGLWYLQVVSSQRYVETLMTQSFRTVRIPAIRGKILDRHGQALAECRPSYNITLYLDELSKQYQQEFQRLRPKAKTPRSVLDAVARQARYGVVSNAVQQLSQTLRQPLWLNAERFQKHYDQQLALPLTILENLSPTQIALFQEQPQRPAGFDLEVQPLRFYPLGATAAHLLGYLRREEALVSDEDGLFNYRLPDFRGVIGVEAVFDADLRGKAGVKSVLVNYLGYRQSEQIWSPAEAGQNLVLTIDARVQQAAEAALGEEALRMGVARLRGAAVVLDPNTGDLLALASSPAYNPNDFIPRISYQQWEQLNDPEWNPTLNRATYGSYAPGSIFKIIIALAALNANVLDPHETFVSPGFYMSGRRRIDDTAPAGTYQFQRAFLKSSNTYFIQYGLKTGLAQLLDMGRRFHLGERTEVPTLQEVSGFLPSNDWLEKRKAQGNPWREGDTANLCIGQGDLTVTPLQMALMTAAIANGGTVYWPRLSVQVQPQEDWKNGPSRVFPPGRRRNELGVSPKSLEVIRAAMVADVEDPEGTGRRAAVPGLRVCGKTGTAEVKHGSSTIRKDTWFVSYAPYEQPRWVVVVLVEGGGSGGGTCAPVAQKIYQTLQRLERGPEPPNSIRVLAHR